MTALIIISITIFLLGILYFIGINVKHRKRFEDLRIGSVYASVLTYNKEKNPFKRKSFLYYMLIIDKRTRNGKYYIKYRTYYPSTNTCDKYECTMKYSMFDELTLIHDSSAMSIWQKYDNLTCNVMYWLEDLEYIADKYANTEMQDLVKGYKNEMNTIYKKVLV